MFFPYGNMQHNCLENSKPVKTRRKILQAIFRYREDRIRKHELDAAFILLIRSVLFS